MLSVSALDERDACDELSVDGRRVRSSSSLESARSIVTRGGSRCDDPGDGANEGIGCLSETALLVCRSKRTVDGSDSAGVGEVDGGGIEDDNDRDGAAISGDRSKAGAQLGSRYPSRWMRVSSGRLQARQGWYRVGDAVGGEDEVRRGGRLPGRLPSISFHSSSPVRPFSRMVFNDHHTRIHLRSILCPAECCFRQ